MGLSTFDRSCEFSGGVPGEGGGAITQRITGRIVAVVLGNRTGGVRQAVAGARDGLRIAGAAKLRSRAVTVGVIPPQFESAVVRLADQAIQFVIVIGAVVRRIGVGRLRDAASGIIGQRAGVVAETMGFEPAIGVETAGVHLVISPTSSFQSLDQVNSRMMQAYPGYLLV